MLHMATICSLFCLLVDKKDSHVGDSHLRAAMNHQLVLFIHLNVRFLITYRGLLRKRYDLKKDVHANINFVSYTSFK